MGKSDKWLLLTFLTIVAGVVGVAGYWVESEPLNIGRYYLPNSGGPVMFEHKAHTDLTDGCESCHHDLLLSDDRYDCSDCHEDFVAEDFDHTDLKTIEAHSCGTCHQIDESAQAQSCRNCHSSVQETDEVSTACIECHDAEYTADLLTHDEMREVHDQDCGSCHYSRVISVAYHEQCNRCHFVENVELFASQEGNVRCEMCHLK
ncbi:MAG: hypothetical protein KAT48_13345 [Bacteroidales bacterium]|nr:hypothetical protein [Bacteroidales bacterium]